jgi:hypothetical protein
MLVACVGLLLWGLQAHADDTFSCPAVDLAALKSEVDACVTGHLGGRNVCTVQALTCVRARTTASGLQTDVKFIFGSIHHERFFVDQDSYHYRNVSVDGKHFRVGFGFHFTVKEKDSDLKATGSVNGIAAEIGIANPKTLSFASIVGIDVVTSGASVYNTLGSTTAKTSVGDYLESYKKVDTAFSGLYTNLLKDDAATSKAVSICPQILAFSDDNPAPAGAALSREILGLEGLLTEAEIAKTAAGKVEAALCDPSLGHPGNPNGILVYAFTDSSGRIAQPDSTTNSVAGGADSIILKYSRRRFFAAKTFHDLHTEFYGNGESGTLGTGSLISALLSLSASSASIKNSGFAYGYPACMAALSSGDITAISSNTLLQLQGVQNLTATFNANMTQIDARATIHGQPGFRVDCAGGIVAVAAPAGPPPAVAPAPSVPAVPVAPPSSRANVVPQNDARFSEAVR